MVILPIVKNFFYPLSSSYINLVLIGLLAAALIYIFIRRI